MPTLTDLLKTRELFQLKTRMGQVFCKNAELAVNAETMKVDNEGCINTRRNGSAHCQECSDKYKTNV